MEILATSPLNAIAAVLVALGSARILSKISSNTHKEGRFDSIDGLRGYLAFFVFLHHSCIWYFYLRGDSWRPPPSNLYIHFGESSVALFFMITGFLFFSKVTSREKSVNWTTIYVSRVLRLAPLYIVTVGMVIFATAVLSDWRLQEPIFALLKSCVKWLLFTIPGNPDLNRIENSRYIMAGVAWSLVYEWIFYLSLPLFALIMRARWPYNYFGLALACVYFLIFGKYFYLSFFGGIIASVLSQFSVIARFSKTWVASLLVIGLLIVNTALFHTSFSVAPIILLSVVFVLIANGNSLFGLLTKKSLFILGDMAYSIYLLHGILLFVCFRFIIGFERAANMTPIQHWSVILLITPVLLTLCFFTEKYIEKPPMRATRGLSDWISAKRISIASRLKLAFT